MSRNSIELTGRPVPRPGGYLPIEDYAAIGDGRTVALIGADGSIDWLCVPHLDSPPVFSALLDNERGGHFALHPVAPFQTSRAYRDGTNVLETLFETASGTVRVIDAMTIPAAGLAPEREIVRKIEGVSGRVEMMWHVDPRFDFGRRRSRLRCRDNVAIFSVGADALAVRGWDAGPLNVNNQTVGGSFASQANSNAMIVMTTAHQEPVLVPPRDDVESRLTSTCDLWTDWSARRQYDGPFKDSVLRSALALKLLIHAPSGAIAAAPTTSLPEDIGGDRNWDYRFCWIRDSAFIMNALLQLGCAPEADAFFWWLMHTSQTTHPRLRVLYRLDGGASTRERTIDSMSGYRDSRPVRVGNRAADQVQLDIYGDLLHTAWLYVNSGRTIDGDIGRRLSATATLVSKIWSERDAGLWEVRSGSQHFTQSKMMCWIALDRARRLATEGHIPARDVPRWNHAAQAIAAFIDSSCWSTAAKSYVRHAGSKELDAGVLLGVLFEYGDPRSARLGMTVDAIRRELGDGRFVARYRGEDGLVGDEGAFLACSFWLVEALALVGRAREAIELMQELVDGANEVGLYAEEIDPRTGEFLGNFPQGLTHLALINAAIALQGVSAQ